MKNKNKELSELSLLYGLLMVSIILSFVEPIICAMCCVMLLIVTVIWVRGLSTELINKTTDSRKSYRNFYWKINEKLVLVAGFMVFTAVSILVAYYINLSILTGLSALLVIVSFSIVIVNRKGLNELGDAIIK